jgi:hypothetical protein
MLTQVPACPCALWVGQGLGPVWSGWFSTPGPCVWEGVSSLLGTIF